MTHFRKTVKVTQEPTHHFFVVDAMLMEPIVTDPDGTVLVYTDRNKAEEEGHRRHGKGTLLATIGMGDAKWAMFQTEQFGKFRVVE